MKEIIPVKPAVIITNCYWPNVYHNSFKAPLVTVRVKQALVRLTEAFARRQVLHYSG
jgi:hypothetical protein